MNTLTEVRSAAVGGDLAGLEPLGVVKRRWPMLIGGALMVLMVVGLARQLLGSGLAGLGRAVPDSPWFYLAFAGMYLVVPAMDYVIFRRLWGIPAAGFAALMKKRISNDALMGYSGEAYFYAWARSHARMVAAPFGAVKDVTILSGIAGNAITVFLVAVALPFGHGLLSPDMLRMVEGSAAVSLAAALVFVLFSKRIFSLPGRQLRWIFWMHIIRLVAESVLLALAWNAGLPGVPVAVWLFLSAGRLLVSRLPMVPNKDLLFANFAIVLIGQDKALSNLIAFTAAVTLLVHVGLLVAFGLHHLVRKVA